MADNDIFDSIGRIIELGPTDDDVRHASSAAQEHQRAVAAATAATMARFAIDDAPAGTHGVVDATAVSTASASTSAPSRSFLTDEEIARYERDIAEVGVESPIFASMLPTTFGLDGELSGIQFVESDIISIVGEHLTFPCIRAVCNFGDVKIPEFDTLLAEHKIDLSTTIKSARARTKKQQRAGAKKRKTQGNGTSFNSSILFWIYSVKYGAVYKVRLFRTGKFGLPGIKPEMIRDILQITRDSFIPMLSRILQAYNARGAIASAPAPAVASAPASAVASAPASAVTSAPAPAITITRLVSIMKNYKWRRLIDPGCILDLHAISSRIHADALTPGRIPYAVNYAYYGYSDSKLSIKFHTPSSSRDDKTVRINIFLSGKINILGAYDSLVTKNICQYIVELLSDLIFIIRPSDDDAANEIARFSDDLSDDDPI